MRKIYPVFLSLLLVYFSFYYTNKVVDIVKSKDPIMLKIKEEKDKYEEVSSNAVLKEKSIIPGKNGRKVNINKSFENMKQYGKYNESLYVFEEVEPDISIDSYYDKYIEMGRSDQKKVAIVFHINRFDSIDDVVNILNQNNVKATFFVDGLFLENNSNKIKSLKDNYEFELLSYNGTYDQIYFENGLKILLNVTGEKTHYCFAEYDQKEVLELCNKLSLHTIIPSINADNYDFKLVKTKLTNGSIIGLKNSTVNLSTILNYIKQRGYDLVTLNDLLLETIEK